MLHEKSDMLPKAGIGQEAKAWNLFEMFSFPGVIVCNYRKSDEGCDDDR